MQTPGNSQGQGSLACCSRWGHKESERTERLNNNYYSSLAHRLGFTTHCIFSKAQSMFHCCSYVAPEHHVMLLTTRPPLFSSLDFRNTYSSDFLSIPLASPDFLCGGRKASSSVSSPVGIVSESVASPFFSHVICIPGHSHPGLPILAFSPDHYPGLQTCLTNGLLNVLQVPLHMLFSKDPLFFPLSE